MPVGRIDFQIGVVRHARLARIQPTGEEARHYNSCFCSYSKHDKGEMLKRLQGMKVSAADMETFVDVLDLRPGDEWNPARTPDAAQRGNGRAVPFQCITISL